MKKSDNFVLFDNQGHRKYISPKERERLYAVLIKLDIAQRTFSLILFWTGVRISEALSIIVEHIDFEEQIITIKSLKKRNKTVFRQIPIPPLLSIDLKLYSSKMKSNDKLWSWTRKSGYRYIKRFMNLANITGIQACPKGLRHGFGVHAINSGVPLTLVSKWMGHSSLSTTAIYLDVVGDEERNFAKMMWNN